ncbi:MAG TPA: hypothetical protein PLC65_07690 [Bacteroidia bacterium]|nr:hypothetical protein [Bacteroidia bacterium]
MKNEKASYTKEEVLTILAKLKFNLENKINFQYLPLQKQMQEAEKRGDIKLYYELENKIAPLRDEVASEYDKLLLVRNTYKEMLSDNG